MKYYNLLQEPPTTKHITRFHEKLRIIDQNVPHERPDWLKAPIIDTLLKKPRNGTLTWVMIATRL